MSRNGSSTTNVYGIKSLSHKNKYSKSNKKRKHDDAEPWEPYVSGSDIDWLAEWMLDRPRMITCDIDDENELPHDDSDDEVLLCSLMGDVVGVQYYKGTVNNQEMVCLCREPYNKYDPNAIKVNNVDCDQVGHIKRELAKPLSQIMDRGLGRIEGIVPFGASNAYRIRIELTVWGKPESTETVMKILHTHSVPAKGSPGPSAASSSVAVPAGLDYSHVVTNRVLLSPSQIKNELDRLFETLDEGDKTSMADKAQAVITTLYPHQKQALNWMMSRENGNMLPPFWEERENGTYFNSLTVFTSNTRPSSVHGGILADDMGLGKTLEMIALILTNFVDKNPLAVPVPGSCRESVPRRIKQSLKNKQNGHMEASSKSSVSGIKKVKNISLEAKMTALDDSLASDFPQKIINMPKIVLPRPSTSAVKSDAKNVPPLPTLKMEKSDSFLCNEKDDEEFIVLSESSVDEEDIQIDKKVPSEKAQNYNSATSRPELSRSTTRPTRTVKKRVRYSKSDDTCSDEEQIPRKKARMLGPSREPTQNDEQSGRGKCKETAKCKGKSLAIKSILSTPAPIVIDDDPEYLPDISCSRYKSQKFTTNESSDEDMPDLVQVVDPLPVDEANLSNCDKTTGRSTCKGPRTTLIICPLSVMNNWLTQLSEHLHPNVHLKIYSYYGPKRMRNSKLLAQHDVVLTTYSTVASDFKLHKNKSPIKKVHWLRIVLDEGHMIRNPNALQTKAIMELKAKRRWVLTGTPIQNSLKDFWSLVNFLNISPLTDRQWWNRTIERPIALGDQSAIRRVQHLMGNIALRRTKTQMVNGKPVVSLPDKTMAIEHIRLSEEERDIYTAMQTEGKLIISRYFRQGTLLRYYGHVLGILMRLRQLCCHPLLVAKAVAAADSINEMDGSAGSGLDEEKKQKLIVSLLDVLNSGSDEECPVCLESVRQPVITSCAHVYCRPCIQAVINNEKPDSKCPLCRSNISENDLLQVPSEGMNKSTEEPVVTPSNWQSSTKVDALMRSLVNLREEDAGIKSIVVSQFTSLLTLLEIPLQLNGFNFVRLDGTMSQQARVESIDKFMDMSPGTPTIFLLSLKAGGVGINLTAASRVFLMDPAWNPASEEQCFDRCHRLGQTRNVVITKFLVEDSIEERMMDLQERKRELMQGAFGKKQTAEQRRAQRITDIKTLINF